LGDWSAAEPAYRPSRQLQEEVGGVMPAGLFLGLRALSIGSAKILSKPATEFAGFFDLNAEVSVRGFE
jgi:hypothetical protein